MKVSDPLHKNSSVQCSSLLPCGSNKNKEEISKKLSYENMFSVYYLQIFLWIKDIHDMCVLNKHLRFESNYKQPSFSNQLKRYLSQK